MDGPHSATTNGPANEPITDSGRHSTGNTAATTRIIPSIAASQPTPANTVSHNKKPFSDTHKLRAVGSPAGRPSHNNNNGAAGSHSATHIAPASTATQQPTYRGKHSILKTAGTNLTFTTTAPVHSTPAKTASPNAHDQKPHNSVVSPSERQNANPVPSPDKTIKLVGTTTVDKTPYAPPMDSNKALTHQPVDVMSPTGRPTANDM